MTDAFELGLALFGREPELLGVEVWWRADKEVGSDSASDYVFGYMKGRRQRDEYEQEKKAQEQEAKNDTHSPE